MHVHTESAGTLVFTINDRRLLVSFAVLGMVTYQTTVYSALTVVSPYSHRSYHGTATSRKKADSIIVHMFRERLYVLYASRRVTLTDTFAVSVPYRQAASEEVQSVRALPASLHY